MNTRIVSLASLAALALTAASCVYTPESGIYFDPGVSKAFGGLSSNPGSTVQLWGFNKNTGAWVQLTQTTAGTTPQSFNTNHTHYYWNINYRLTTRADYLCFVHSSCTIPGEGTYEVRFQVREVGATPTNLYTFDEGGLACWNDAYSNGTDMYAAYWNCRAEIYDEVRLNVVYIF